MLARFPRSLLVGLLATCAAAQATRVEVPIAAHTTWATVATIVDSGNPGPTVLLVGGVHGNEPAGYRAVRQISGWQPSRGRLVLIAAANQPALAANQRRMPGLSEELSDLNRQFPTAERPAPRGELATALWQFVQAHQPDLLLDLHEGTDFAQQSKSVGSSVIGTGEARAAEHAKAALSAVNATITAKELQFVGKATAVAGSLVRAAATQLRVPALILETTSKGQPLALRARQHRLMVHAILTGLGMIEQGPHQLLGTLRDRSKVAVGLFSAAGVAGRGPEQIEQQLEAQARFQVRRFGPEDVQDGVLQEFDVVIFPGGSGSGQAKALGEAGRDRVRQFVRDGGGYLGICAGAYLAAHNYAWSLALLDANVLDREHWQRGVGEVQIEWTAAGRTLIAPGEGRDMHYANGPLYGPAGDEGLPDFEVLALFRSEMTQRGAPSGVMLGTPAIVRGTCGKGNVVCASPHPELSANMAATLARLVLLAKPGP